MLGGLGASIPNGSGASLMSGGLTGSGGGGAGAFSGMPSTASFLKMQNNLNIANGVQGGSGALSAASNGAANNCNNLENF